MSPTLSNVKDIKNIKYFLVEKNKEIIYSSEDENPPKYSEDGQIKYLKQTLNSINALLMLLVMS